MMHRYKWLLFLPLIWSGINARAQSAPDPLEGTYILYRPANVRQELKLSGLSSGTYSLTKTWGDDIDYTKGYWRREKLWRPHTDSMNVIVLDYENEYETTYLQIEPTGCLTPVHDDGYRHKRAYSFAPLRGERLDR